MSADDAESGDGGPGSREVAYRPFAAEFDDATLQYSESDEERAPNYVVTPAGLRINRLFAVGVLTEVQAVNEETLRGRVVDPTGAFVTYAGQYQPDETAFLDRTEPPAFVALTGKARTFEPDDADVVYTSVRPESLNLVDDGTRDRWSISAAEATLNRIAVFKRALETDLRGDDLRLALEDGGVAPAIAAGVPLALDHYGTGEPYLEGLRQLAVDTLEVVADERDEVRPLEVTPGERDGGDLGPLPEIDLDLSGGLGGTSTASVDDSTGTDAGTESPGVEADSSMDADSDATAASAGPMSDAGRADRQGATASDESDDATVDDLDDFDAGGSIGDPVDEDDLDADAITADDGVGDFEDEVLDDDEREEIEAEYGTDFATGSEVEEPGAADIDTPDPEEPDADDVEGDISGESEPDEVDLEAAAVEAMEELDDGDGADREEVIAAVVDLHDADPEAVEDAIQDALMGGKCYEPGEDRLKPI